MIDYLRPQRLITDHSVRFSFLREEPPLMEGGPPFFMFVMTEKWSGLQYGIYDFEVWLEENAGTTWIYGGNSRLTEEEHKTLRDRVMCIRDRNAAVAFALTFGVAI